MPELHEVTDQSYYIGANTCLGFINCAKNRLDELNKLYIIKGGPGTGKSTFMKELATRAGTLGYTIEKYYCSSDPSSLDAVIIRELSLGVVDGTPPHKIEPACPGIKEELIDLGQFWNSAFLIKFKNEVEKHGKIKSSCFSSAYRYFKAASIIRDEEEAWLSACFDQVKAKKAIKRLMAAIKNGDEYEAQNMQISAVGMNGKSKLSTFEATSKILYSIIDKRGVSSLLFNIILNEAKEKKLKTQISYDPLMRIDAIFLPESKIAFTLSSSGKILNAERFIIKDEYSALRQKLKFLKCLKEEIMTSAELELKEAKKHHFALESIYSEAMDYLSLNDMTEEFMKNILE